MPASPVPEWTVPDMRRDHWQWLESHLQEVNEAFEIDLSLDTPEARNIAEESIDIYDTEDAFNDDFEGVYLRWECAFEIQSWEGYAACIAGKYVSFREFSYTYYQRH